MDKEKAKAAAQALMDAEWRNAAQRQRERTEATGRRLLYFFMLIGFVGGVTLAPGFGGSRLVWGTVGLVGGHVVGWLFRRAVAARRTRGH